MKTNESHSSRRYKDENDTNSSSDNQSKDLLLLKSSFDHIKKVNYELVESVRILTEKQHDQDSKIAKYVEDIKDLDANYHLQLSQYSQIIKQMRAQIASLEGSISILSKRKGPTNKLLHNEETQWQWDNSTTSNFSNYKNAEQTNLQSSPLNSSVSSYSFDQLQNQYIQLQSKYMQTENQLEKVLSKPLYHNKLTASKVHYNYKAEQGDALDCKIGEFMGSYNKTNTLNVPLIRISEGVYLFGTQRLLISCTNEGKIMVVSNNKRYVLYDYLKYNNEIEYVKANNCSLSRSQISKKAKLW